MLATRAAITLAAARLRLARPHSRAAATRPLAASTVVMASTPKLKLTYFNIKARAEPTRLALFIGGIPFEDIRLSHGEEWPAHKGEMPYGQVPVRNGRCVLLTSTARRGPRRPAAHAVRWALQRVCSRSLVRGRRARMLA